MAGKKESTFINMVLVLFIVTLVASATLGYVYELTKTPIATAKQAKKIKAIKQVVPTFDNNPNEEMFEIDMPDGGKLEFYPATNKGELVGTAIKTYTNKGFSGLVWLMVGLKPNGTIHNIAVLEHKETPGLGTKMDGPFKDQFLNQNPSNYKLSVKKDGGNVDAITAATISSRAFCDAVQRAYYAYMEQSKGNQKTNTNMTNPTAADSNNQKKGGTTNE